MEGHQPSFHALFVRILVIYCYPQLPHRITEDGKLGAFGKVKA